MSQVEPSNIPKAPEEQTVETKEAHEDNVTEIKQSSVKDDHSEAYSIFTPFQKKLIVATASFCAFFSPATSSIYFPALEVIAHDLNVSNTAVNLTITTYLIFQGLAPTFVAGFSEGAGRRPALILCFIFYIAANIGLGAQNSYAALLALRCVQSAGSSGTVAISLGITADVVSSAERGSYMAIASAGIMVGPMIAPILGGLISQYLGWHWIFWFLAILAGAVLVPLLVFFPETNRNIVDDGSYPPPSQCQSLASIFIARKMTKDGVRLDLAKQEQLRSNYKLRFPNPFATLRIASDKAGFIILLGNALVVANMYNIPTGIAFLFTTTYAFNQIQLALCFLPFGAGSVVASFVIGRLLDRNYKKHALRLGLPVVKNRRQDLDGFPIEKARLELGIPMVCAGMAVTIAYGWVLESRTSFIGPVVLLFFIGAMNTAAFQAMNVLMVDNFPDQAATAGAAGNLFRCILGAGTTAMLAPLLNAWGAGWTYTFTSLLWVVYSPALLLLLRRGPRWRKERLEMKK